MLSAKIPWPSPVKTPRFVTRKISFLKWLYYQKHLYMDSLLALLLLSQVFLKIVPATWFTCYFKIPNTILPVAIPNIILWYAKIHNSINDPKSVWNSSNTIICVLVRFYRCHILPCPNIPPAIVAIIITPQYFISFISSSLFIQIKWTSFVSGYYFFVNVR